MGLTIDTNNNILQLEDGTELDLFGKEAYETIAELWLKLSWNQKYPYTFTWMGRPIIQHPEDLVRLQEVIYQVKPTVILETGIAHGGSLILSASLLRSMRMDDSRVIGVDIEIRTHNRKAIEEHELSDMITLIEGDAVADTTIAEVSKLIKPEDTVIVILDSNHTYDHVLNELNSYSKFVSIDSYIVSTDGIMRNVADTPLGHPGWVTDNPANAAEDFVACRDDFKIETPKWLFNESNLDKSLTAWPSAWLKRTS